ncbi:MAG TPA: chromate transporter [Caldisericia bacterium]|nr:chromate transporter [Caldisericia bacterium]HPB33461.1 chromate transporter [Caldisericia bacterium]HQL66257.1 chromate transporter [Caldisericia bacterium]HQN48120.1 chromate transporter [Caldisericia bacterium]HQP00359.1 chromate transporter [Caldisericia bacterium]
MIAKLFLIFLKIGFFSYGGGWSSLSIIKDELVNVYKLISLKEFLDMVSIAEITPGPIAVNLATYIGIKYASFIGGFFATLGLILPGIIILILLETLLSFLSKKYNLEKFYKSLKVGVSVLVLYATYLMLTSAIIDIKSLIIFTLLLVLIFVKKEIHPLIIVFSGGLGLLLIKMI